MNNKQANRRTRIARATELFALAIALLTTFVVGAGISPWINPWYSRLQVNWPVVETSATQDDDLAKAFARLNRPRSEDPRQPEPRAVEERARIIHRDAAAIQAECRRAAGGDWDQWQARTAPYRAALKTKIDALKDFPDSRTVAPEGHYEALEGLDGFPLFEVGSRLHLNYLYDPAQLDEFRRSRAVVAANRWLRQRGIDLIFVPVPKMTEVYIDHFVEPCPADGIISPHVRRTLLELLNEDVEVVDGLSLFRSVRDASAEYLCNTADTHWAPRGMRVMAKELADRIARYKFGARARYDMPIVTTTSAPYILEGSPGGIGSGIGWQVLNERQRSRAAAVQTTSLPCVTLIGGGEPRDDPRSPVLLVGHSYTYGFREQLIRELNLLIAARIYSGGTSEFFGDFLREPTLLDHTRVVVWITTEQHMTQFAPMPKPIADCLKATISPPDTSRAPKPSSPP
jgi:hypothetical protein